MVASSALGRAARAAAAMLFLQCTAHGAGSSAEVSEAEALSSVGATAAGRLLSHSMSTLDRATAMKFWRSSGPAPAPEGGEGGHEPSHDEPSHDSAEPSSNKEPQGSPAGEEQGSSQAPVVSVSASASQGDQGNGAPAVSEPASASRDDQGNETPAVSEPASASRGDQGNKTPATSEPAAASQRVQSSQSTTGQPPVEDLLPDKWSEPRRRELLEGPLKHCVSNEGKGRGSISKFFGFGKSDYQRQVDELVKRCDEYTKSQTQASGHKSDLKKLIDELSEAKALYEEHLVTLRDLRAEIKTKGKAVQDMDRLLQQEKTRGKG